MRNRTGFLISILCLNIFFLTLAWGNAPRAQAAPAASITVDSLADTTGGGVCTLRDAIKTVNDNLSYGTCNTGADTIIFSVNGVITLTSDLPTLVKSMTIQS